MCSASLKQGGCTQKMEAMITSSIERGFLRGNTYSEINRQNIRLTCFGPVTPFHTECSFNTSTRYCPVCHLFPDYQAFEYSLSLSSFRDKFHLIRAVNLSDLPVQAIHIPVNIMKVISAATVFF